MRSETAFFSSGVICRRFLLGLSSEAEAEAGAGAGAAAAGFLGEERRALRLGCGAESPSIFSTSLNALISAWRRSI